ncbi:50S ribosomal protein L15 [Ureaplasma ceti]|uniref:Large ribosomal subunit protein uL15 n=1 Tax=Ureaplasma ceti TaxID=3119530 RepID=A0ABP9UAI4_9BACT
MELHNLEFTNGSRGQKAKRVGRGHGSGMGKTSTRGSNGQKSRKSGHTRLGFEGGQTPLYRRVPKVGFNNVNFANNYNVISLAMLNDKKLTGEIDMAKLDQAGLIEDVKLPIKVIGNAKVDSSLVIKAHKFSAGAIKAIEASGAKYELVK